MQRTEPTVYNVLWFNSPPLHQYTKVNHSRLALFVSGHGGIAGVRTYFRGLRGDELPELRGRVKLSLGDSSPGHQPASTGEVRNLRIRV